MKNSEITLQSNEILEAGAYLSINGNKKPMTDVIAESIVADYFPRGIKGATVSVFCAGNYKSESGRIVRDFNNEGEMLKIGDIVKVMKTQDTPYLQEADKSPVYFRVISTTFKFDGSPTQDIKLMQVRKRR